MPTRVLVVQASRTEALRTRLILEKAGLAVSLAADGQEGLAKSATDQPDVVLLDTIMPRMSGYEVCGKLRLNPDTAGIPVVMVAAEEEQAEIPPSALARYLVKPFAPPQLIDRLTHVAAEHTAAVVGSAPAPTPEAGLPSTLYQDLGVGRLVLQNGLIVSADEAVGTLLNKPAAELAGQPFTDFLREDFAAFADLLARAMQRSVGAPGTGAEHGQINVWLNGSSQPHTWRILAAPTVHKGQSAIELACQDVTRLAQAEQEVERAQQELRQARQQVAAANRARGDFLANMSHELRTPIHELMGMLDLVLGHDVNAEQRAYLNTARTSSNALLTIVSDILEFSDLEAGQLELEEKEFVLAEPIESTIEIMAPRAKEKGLKLACHLPVDAPKTLVGDPKRLRQVLANLISNAVKFTEHGEINLRVDIEGANDNQVDLHLSVSDTGIGIPQDKQDIIFEPFRQADNSSTRRYGGLGLGLAMAQQLVRLMGGNIWVESQVGQGSIFHFSATLKRPKRATVAAAAARPAVERVTQLQILLAEDSPTNQLIAVSNLKKVGHTVTVAGNGLKAVQIFEEKGHRDNRSFFDLVLMDVAMPEMDGLEATRNIRDREKVYGGHVPIVAMTAFTTKEYHDKCFEAGMDAYVSKPVRIEELNRTIEPFLAREPEPPPPPAPTEVAIEASPISMRDALEVMGGDVDIMKEAVAMSLEEVPEQLRELEDAMAWRNAKQVEAKAHRLKGIMGNVGGMIAREAGQRLETMGENGDLGGGEEALRLFKKEIERVQAFYSNPAWEERARECAEGMDG